MLTICSCCGLATEAARAAAEGPPCLTAGTGGGGGGASPLPDAPVFLKLDLVAAAAAFPAAFPVVIMEALVAARFAFLFHIW